MHSWECPTPTGTQQGEAMKRLLLFAVALAVALAGPAPTVTQAEASLPVEGYLMAVPGAQRYVTQNAAKIAVVGVDGVNLTKSGAKLTKVPKAAAAIVKEAHARGLKAELLVSNYDSSIGDFSSKIAGRLLKSKKHRAAVVKSLVAKVKKGHFDGVQIDLESLKASHAAGLTSFVKSLRKALPARKKISMAVMSSETAGGYAKSGYQLTKLTKRINRFVLMAYDQHGPTWSNAGPVGGTPWVRQVLAAFIKAKVPKAKIDLGVGEYGYTWPADGSAGASLSVAQARTLAGDRATFDALQQEWTATLADGTVLWWADGTTFTARKALAAEQGLHGLAVWELSLGDPIS